MYHNQSTKAGNMAGGANSRVDHQQKKYNTIDANTVQNMGGLSANNNLMSQSPAPTGHTGANVSPVPQPGQHVGVTADTAGTSNPSNEANSNAEFIDIMRKVPRILCERYELMDVLGKGAHGRIYLATDLVTHDRVAIKLMEKSSKNKSKFQREISLMKDMMKLAKKKPLRENCVHYQDPETVQLNTKLLQQQQQSMSRQGSQSQIAMTKNRRIGFPRLYSYCSDQNYYYLVMQLLGVNLKELKESFKECKFSIQTVIIIALQLMNRLNSIHSQGYIHRDLKPANVVIGNESNEAHFIYLIDFGLAKKESSTNPPIDPKHAAKGAGATGEEEEVINIIDPKTGKKKTATQTLREYMVEEQDNFRVVGTAMYAALAAHLPNKKYLKKDDIESLLYLLSYFGVGQLPWRYKTNQEGLEKMMQYKFEIKPRELFPPEIFPKNFQFLYEYIRALPDDEEADYTIIERELMAAAHQVKLDPTLLIALDWMNCRPLVAQSPASSIHGSAQAHNRQLPPAQSPQTQPRPGRQINNSQLSKNSQNVPGLKTPMHSDKNGKKQPFTMTPDIHTKTYAERSGLGGIATGFGPVVANIQNSAQAQYQQKAYSNMHMSAKGKQVAGLTVGGQGIGQQNTGVYGLASAEHDSVRGMQDTNQGDNANQEDLIMMNIPREGNAEQLNKSTKLTLSSKKQYDNHMQNIPIHQHVNNQGGQQSQQQQYMQFNTSASGMSVLGNINVPGMNHGQVNRAKMNSTMMVKFNSSTEKGINVNTGANARGNLNKSTLLPSNFVSNRMGVAIPQSQLDHFANLGPTGPASVGGNVRASNGNNPAMSMQVGTTGGNQPGGHGQLKLNPNLVGNNGQIIPSGGYSAMEMQNQNFFDQQNNGNNLDHLNRSLNMHQMQSAFTQNNSFQQSPPNIRSKAQTVVGGQLANSHAGPHHMQLNQHQAAMNSATHHKFNNLFEKNKSSTLNIKVQQTAGANMQASGPSSAGYMSGLQTISNANSGVSTQKQNFLPSTTKGNVQWASNTTGQTPQQQAQIQQAFAQAKNKERYVAQQQQQQNRQQYYMGGSQSAQGAAATPSDMQNQLSMMHQSPTLSPTGGHQQQPGQNQNMSFQTSTSAAHPSSAVTSNMQNYSNYKSIKIGNQQQQQQSFVKTQGGKVLQSAGQPGTANNNGGTNQSQFGSRLSQNTNMSGTTKKSAGGTGANSQKAGNNFNQMSSAMGSPLKGTNSATQPQSQTLQQQQSAARQSKNSSALGIIGGSIVSNNQGPNGANQTQSMAGASPAEANTSSQGNMIGSTGSVQNQFNMTRQKQLNKGGMMYNTMYGSSSATTGGGAMSLAPGSQQFQGPSGTKSGNGANSQRPGIISGKMGTQGMTNPIHIKIEDQTGVFNGGKGTIPNQGPSSYSMNAVSPNPQQHNKQQFQQTGQKFGGAIKAQHMSAGQPYSKTGPNSAISTKKSSQGIGIASGPGSFNRNKSKSGLGNQATAAAQGISTGGATLQQSANGPAPSSAGQMKSNNSSNNGQQSAQQYGTKQNATMQWN